MYEVLETSLATVSRSYEYQIRSIYGADFNNLKGFGCPWLLDSHHWQKGEKVLDVGGAYSELPIYIQKAYGCEIWVADDFGLDSAATEWTRGRSPKEHIAAHPEVMYVLERVGPMDKSSLPENYFDVVYSLSALEHAGGLQTPAVWRHMDRLLKPGGELLHEVDVIFPSNAGVKSLLKACAFDLLFPLLPKSFRLKHCIATPQAYLRVALGNLGTPFKHTENLSLINMALNPDILAESYRHGFYRLTRDNIKDFRYKRFGALLIHLKKVS
ncbi:MAG TPA: class I SAM-dependent methyltransferase [Anaerolineales bacterium]